MAFKAMLRRRVFGFGVAFLLLGSCSSEKVLYPSAGSVTLRVVDDGLGTQTSATPSYQFARWVVEEAEVEIEGFGDYAFLGRVPCWASGSSIGTADLATQCSGSLLSLRADRAGGAVVRVGISAMELRRAWRPELPAEGDYDGDGVENGSDNCEIVPNPDQEIVPEFTHGTACATIDPFTLLPTSRDTDADGERDSFDNCVWVWNPGQEDSDGDRIGDACARTTRVVLDEFPLRLEFPPIDISVAASSVAIIDVEFDDRTTLVDCDAGSTICRLDSSQISVSLR